MKYSEYFDTKRHLSLKNENIRYDTKAGTATVFGEGSLKLSGKVL